jgi:hypothetical protein
MQALSTEQLQKMVPSVFAIEPWGRMSDRYRFVPTIEVVDVLRDQGFLPVRANQSRTRIPGKGEFTKHMLRFRHTDYLRSMQVGEEIPELVLTNSHDGTSAYKFNSGVFRLVCTNGLVVASHDWGGIAVRHKGAIDFRERVIDATFEIVEQTPKTMAQIDTWKQLQLTPPQQTAFGEAAKELLDNQHVTVPQLLAPRRPEDRQNDLWHTMNRVQENMMKGGLRGRTERGRRTQTRPITSVDRDLKLNKALWTLAERMSTLVN